MKKRISAFLLASAVMIASSGCSAQTSEGSGTSSAQDADAIKIVLAGSTDQKINEGGRYILSGSLSDAKLVIDTDQEVYLQLDGVTINNSKGPAVQVENAKQLTVSANEGTKNELSDGGTDEMNAAFFSNDTVIFEGKGELRINGNNEHGVESDDDIIINGSDIIINAVNDALHATDNITINGGNVTVEKSEEGIESKNDIIVNGGNVKVNSNDDALNASNDITINGGEVYANASKGDAIDSNGTIHITGGTVTAIGADMPEASIDCDGNNLIITGGTIIGAAGSTSMPTSESSTQPSVILAGAAKGETISISDESGELMTFTADKSFSTLIFSSPEISQGEKLTVTVAGKERETVTVSAMVTNQGGSAGMGGKGGFGGAGGKGTRPEGDRPLLPDGTQPPSPDGAEPAGDPPAGAPAEGAPAQTAPDAQ